MFRLEIVSGLSGHGFVICASTGELVSGRGFAICAAIGGLASGRGFLVA